MSDKIHVDYVRQAVENVVLSTLQMQLELHQPPLNPFKDR